VILYRSPKSTVSMRITDPLRRICQDALKDPMSIYEREHIILKLFAYTEDCIKHISILPIDEINEVLTENEKRKGIMSNLLNKAYQNKDTSTLSVSPNTPVAVQVIEDKVIDMLIFLTLRYMKNFHVYKQKKLDQIETFAQTLEALAH